MPRLSTGTLVVTTALGTVLALSLAANAQTINETVSSPFAKKAKKQAWETQDTPSQAYSEPSYSSSYVPPSSTTTASAYGTYTPPSKSALSGSTASSSTSTPPVAGSYAPPTHKSYKTDSPTLRSATASGAQGAYYPGRTVQPSDIQSVPKSKYAPPSYVEPDYVEVGYPQTISDQPSYMQYAQNSGSNLPPRMPSSGGSPYPPTQSAPLEPEKRGWGDRLGLKNIAHSFSGYLRLGAAGTDRNTVAESGWSEDFIMDGAFIGEVSALTSGGLEYGAGGEVRAQYDQYRRGFGGRVGDCPPTLAGCASVDVAGTPTAIRGHTSQFYTSGPSNAQEAELQLEGAYLFLRSGYGDVTIGRDDGAAYLFSLGAPSLLAVGASNSPVDYTGLDAVKTVNDASGFAEKITYTSPRLLGDHIVGVQFGASYAPDSKACGVDYCVRSNGKDDSGALAPDIEDVFEAGVAIDKTFGNGMSFEVTGTYAMGSEQSALAVFDDLETYGLGVELGYMDWTLGGSYLQSNNGLMNGDYVAYDAGLTWQPGKWGVTLGYGHSEDKNIGLESDQALVGVSYDFNDRYRLGTGVQYIERTTPFNLGGIVTPTKEDAMSVFVEGRVTF